MTRLEGSQGTGRWYSLGLAIEHHRRTTTLTIHTAQTSHQQNCIGRVLQARG